MGFSRKEYWSGFPFSSPGDLPDPGIKLRSPALQADALTSEPPGKPDVIKVIANTRSTIINSSQFATFFREQKANYMLSTISGAINVD